MDDRKTTIHEIRDKINRFSKERGWTEGENTKNLVMALSIEVAELMEIFQWVHSDDADNIRENPEEFEHLREEIADVFWYLARICNHYNIDLSRAVEDKSIKNAKKYPVK